MEEQPTQPTTEAPTENPPEFPSTQGVVTQPEPTIEPPKQPVGRPCGFCQRKDEVMGIVLRYIEDFTKDKSPIPYIEELALALDVDEDTISNWCNKKREDGSLEHEEFFGAIKKVKMIQKLKLLKRTNGRYQPTGAIFQLKVNHGAVESEKRILTGDSREPLEIIFTEAKVITDE